MNESHLKRERFRAQNREIAREILDFIRSSKAEEFRFGRAFGPNRSESKNEFSLAYFILLESFDERPEFLAERVSTDPVIYRIEIRYRPRDQGGVLVRRSPPARTERQLERVEALEILAEEIRQAHAGKRS